MTPEELEKFSADEQPAIGQLRHFVGRSFAPNLDGTLDSLALLDQFVANLTSDRDWARSSLFCDISNDMKIWLAVRIAYYFGWCLRSVYGAQWTLSRDADSPVYGTPVMLIQDVEISPLEIAHAYLDGGVQGGLVGLISDLENEIRSSTH